MTTLIGHERQNAQLEKALSAGKLHHGLIFAGLRGIGKASAAYNLATKIVDPDGAHRALTENYTHPDILIIERPFKNDLKEGETREPDDERKRSISVDQIRKLHSTLAKMTAISDKRAVIIDAADDFEPNAANALLKALEEPPEGCHFLLVSHASDRLLPTIRSRCQIVHFDPLNDEQISAVLQALSPNSDPVELQALARAGEGSPGQAMEFAGLDIGEIEQQISAIIAGGDADNAIRFAMASKLALKAAQPRYEAFLRRVPPIIAANAKTRTAGDVIPAIDAWEKANALSARAMALTLDKKAVILEMGSLLASLNRNKQAA